MQLHLENIGKISEADIDIKGITVIAGENDTGKSTVGKVLFSIFKSFYNIDKEILDARIRLFSNELKKLFENNYSDDYNIDSLNISKELFKNDIENVDIESISDLLYENIEENEDISYFENDPLEISDKFFELVKNLFEKYKRIPDEKICMSIFNTIVKNEFDFQVLNIYSDLNYGNISLEINDKHINITIKENKTESIERTLSSLKTEILYIDDPSVLDNLSVFYYGYNYSFWKTILAHKRHLLSKILSNGKTKDVEAAFHEVLITDRLEIINNKISKICRGSLSYHPQEGILYSDNEIESTLSLHNISAGLKTFAIIKSLLLNGSLKENGTIVLDEPEIHLHPEWQILLAEIIVLLHKEFKMHILLTTHSPYFLEAIEVYSQKNNVDTNCKYYLAENYGNTSKIIDVTEDTEKIYIKLAKPFQDLENERYSDV